MRCILQAVRLSELSCREDEMCLRCSGTTGDPKGVEITHTNIVSGIAAIVQYTQVGCGHNCCDTCSMQSYLCDAVAGTDTQLFGPGSTDAVFVKAVAQGGGSA